MARDSKVEIIIRQHRHWTHWIEAHRIMGEGNLVLTNRRLLFLHRIPSSPQVDAAIKKLADAPIETVLNHALTLHKNCFQIPLPSIVRVGIGASIRFPFPRFCLSISYRKGNKQTPHTVTFQFRRARSQVFSLSQIFSTPQIIQDWSWVRAINRAIREAVSPETTK